MDLQRAPDALKLVKGTTTADKFNQIAVIQEMGNLENEKILSDIKSRSKSREKDERARETLIKHSPVPLQ